MNDDLRLALLRADPRLSRFDPLPRIITYDDFDDGCCGWTPLIGNYEDSLDSILPPYRDLRGPMLSNLTVWDTGTDGSAMGTYALKLATRPHAGALAVALKRLTFRKLGPFGWRPTSPSSRKPRNSVSPKPMCALSACCLTFRTWTSRTVLPSGSCPISAISTRSTVSMSASGSSKRNANPCATSAARARPNRTFILRPKAGRTSPAATNGSATTRSLPSRTGTICVSTSTSRPGRYLRLQCNDRVLNVADTPPMRMPAMANLWCMLNTVFFVETDRQARVSLPRQRAAVHRGVAMAGARAHFPGTGLCGYRSYRDPKNLDNVGGVLHAAACFGAAMVAITGTRYHSQSTDTAHAYREIPLLQVADLHEIVPFDCIPVAVQRRADAIPLPAYEHPERAFYVFGPEDGDLGRSVLSWCHDVVYIPTYHSINLAAVVKLVVYDRYAKSSCRDKIDK